jgi:hypothetical protein
LVTVNDSNLQASTSLSKFDIITISPKLRGYQFGSVNKITLNMFSFTSATGIFDGYLASFDGTSLTHVGPRTQGKKGDVIRFYDETNIDYIDVVMDPNAVLTDFSNQKIDFQLFPTLQLDTDIMLLGTCQVNDSNQTVNKIVDRRQFGNISEKDLSDSVFDFMSIPEKHLHSNGVIRGFDIFNVFSGSQGIINFAGGVVIVDGKIIDVNNDSVSIPIVKETYLSTLFPVNWAVCINSDGDYVTIPLLDYDVNLGTPSIPGRTFTASEFVSSTTYTLPAVLFSDLINKRTSLTVLYIASSVVTGTPSSPVITLTVKDARKFVYKKDWGENSTLCLDANNGEFRSFEALTSWVVLNSNYNSTFNVKGLFTSFPGTITFTNPNTSAAIPVIFNGDGAATFSPTNGQFGMLGVELHNLQINSSVVELNSAPVVGCTFNYAPAGVGHFTTFTTRMLNCTINMTTAGTIQFFAGTICENVTINMNSANESLYISTILKNSTININGANCFVTIDVNAIVENCTFNLSGANCTWAVTGSMLNNTVNWNNVGGTQLPISCPVPTGGNAFRFVDNKFSLGTSGSALSSFIAVSDTVNGIINGNQFFRGAGAGGGTLTNGYILAPASYTSGAVSVEGNFFDRSTIDGTDQNIVKNLPLPWLYRNNLNTPPVLAARTVTTSPYSVVAIDNILLVSTSAGAATTIAVASNGAALPQATINVASTVGFPTSGTILVVSSTGLQNITYTNTTGTTFTGCTGGTGTLSTSNAVTTSFTVNLPQISLVPPGRTLTIKDAAGNFDTFTLVLHKALPAELIEGLSTDYIYYNPYGSVTLIAVGSGWIII